MKITQEQQKQGQELYGQIVSKAWEDASFKEQLITSPVETIKTFTDGRINFPNEVSIVVEDQMDASTIYVNIPKKIDLENLELSEEQLELIAGGWVNTEKNIFYDIGYNFGLWLCENKVDLR